MRSFFEDEQDIDRAVKRAKANKEFWCMVYSGRGISYCELKSMDLGEYREAVEAHILFATQWSKK